MILLQYTEDMFLRGIIFNTEFFLTRNFLTAWNFFNLKKFCLQNFWIFNTKRY